VERQRLAALGSAFELSVLRGGRSTVHYVPEEAPDVPFEELLRHFKGLET
jgi:hypothetical protein